MHIAALYIYPIKSLSPVRLDTSNLGPHGLLHDRRFLLERVDKNPAETLMIGREPKMATFTVTFTDASTLRIRHNPTSREIVLPLHPADSHLRPTELTMHSSPATGAQEVTVPGVGEFFSECLGFETRLLYLPEGGSRPILGSVVPKSEDAGKTIGFADCAPVMIASLPSLRAVPCSDGDIIRFRPNIVVEGDGDLEAWGEDWWKVLGIEGMEVELTANCVRCRSLDVDFEGGWLEGEERRLKRLMKERRVDKGAKYSPVFGRYGVVRGQGGTVKVGDKVTVKERSEERTILRWPGIGTGWKECAEEGAQGKKEVRKDDGKTQEGHGKEGREGMGFLERTRTATNATLERTRSIGDHGVKEGFDEAGTNCVIC